MEQKEPKREEPSKEPKAYPTNFPKEEFDKKLDEILVKKPITEKTLQDLVYDIMERKGILTMERMIAIYNSPRWANVIEEIMSTRKYSIKEGDKNVYTPD